MTTQTPSAPVTERYRVTGAALPEWMREYLLRRRQVLLMELGQIEDTLGIERTVTPKRKR